MPAPVLLVVMVSVLGSGLSSACSSTATPSADSTDRNATVYGSNVWQAPGEDRRAAVTRLDATYGPLPIARVFSEWLPPAWSGLERDLGPRQLVVSFRLPPSRILSGVADGRLTTWFRAAPRDRDTFWAYFHEPEDETERGDFTPQEFAEAWRHVARLAATVDNPRLHATMILMCWTVNERSRRDWRSFVPHSGEVDVLAWDCYAKGADADTYADPAELLEPARRASEAVGADWAIAEVGARVDPGAASDRAAWIEEVGAYADRHGARFVTWFDAPIGGEFRLTDEPSIRAWAHLVRSWASRRPSVRHRGGKAA